MEQEKRRVLVTGAGRGIGAAIALRLGTEGYHVWVHYRRSADAARQVCETIVTAGGSAETCCCDVADRTATTRMMETLLSDGPLYGLVINAGIRDDGLLVFLSPQQWDTVLQTNLDSFFALVRPAVKQMLLARSGRIVAISSTSAESGMSGQVHYAAAKAGLIGAVKSLARECASRNVLVNACTPGFIATDMTREINTKETRATIPMRRFGTPFEVAGAVTFLFSDDAAYITGQVLGINGGIYM